MKSFFLLFFMIPSIVSAMEGDAKAPNLNPLWSPWDIVDTQTDKTRQCTLINIKRELTTTLQKLNAHNIPDEQKQPVENVLNQWLNDVKFHLQSLATQANRTNIDIFLSTYWLQEDFIRLSFTCLENFDTASQNTNDV